MIEEAERADVVVIGAGLSGLMEAVFLLGEPTIGCLSDRWGRAFVSAIPGSVVEIRSAVQRCGRNLAFIRVEAFVLEPEVHKPLTLATVTKSIISMAQRLRHR